MKNSPLTARRVVAGLGAGVLALSLASCAGGEPDSAGGDGEISGEVIWADYGGPTNEARQAAYFEGFADETGVDVVSVSIEDAIYMSMLEGDPGDYDIFQIGTADVLAPTTTGLVEIPEDSQGDLLPDGLREYVAGGFYIGMAQGWLTETFPDGGPEDWVDFFDTEAFPGKRAWPGAPGSFDASYEIALLADGVAPEDLYPLDFERAEAKLDSIRDDLVFYQSYPEVQQLLTSGSASIAVSVTGQFTALQNAGEDVTVQYNQAFISPNGFVIPAEAANPDAALALAAWMDDPENEAAFVEKTGYGPVNQETFDYLPEDVAARLVNAPDRADLVLEWDEDWRAENRDVMLDQYTEWLAG